MSIGSVVELARQTADRARVRFVHWDDALWEDLLQRALVTLVQKMQSEGVPPDAVESAAKAYLQLVAEGMGLGYFYPVEASGRRNVFSLLFGEVLPEQLGSLPTQRHGATLEQCWNLSENLETAPSWLHRIFLRLLSTDPSLATLEERVGVVSARTLAPPEKRLAASPSLHWIAMREHDARFLPGWVHFLAPTVVCVHDRLRGSAGRGDVTCGVWLDETPMLLGPMGCTETCADKSSATEAFIGYHLRDTGLTAPHQLARNEWRAAASLVTSQLLVALIP